MMNLLNDAHLESNPSKGEAAKALYGDITYDTALPVGWVTNMENMGHSNVSSHFVWVYPQDAGLLGRPGPITSTGVAMLALASLHVA